LKKENEDEDELEDDSEFKDEDEAEADEEQRCEKVYHHHPSIDYDEDPPIEVGTTYILIWQSLSCLFVSMQSKMSLNSTKRRVHEVVHAEI
jgi:hypothetical protein